MIMQNIFTILGERSDFFLQLLWQHTWISLLSIVLAIVIGLSLGIFISEFKKSSSLVLGLVNFIYTIPAISLLGFLIPFSGIGNVTAIIALTVYALLPMLRNTYTGLENIDKNVLEAAVGMGSTNTQLLYKIKLPLAFPVILSGLRNMVVMTIALAGIASFIGAGGLGVAIYRGITTNNSDMTIAGSLLIALLALFSDFSLGALEKRFQKQKRHRSKHKKTKHTLIYIVAGLVLFVFAWGGWQFMQKRQSIHIATKPMSEQYVLGYMLAFLIEQDSNVTVKITQGVGGGTANIHPAMIKGDFDLYPEYTGTSWNYVLKEQKPYNEKLYPQLQKKYQEQYNLMWLGLYGFNNTFGLAVRKEIAERFNLKTYSDLAQISHNLTFGAEYDFYEREDGYNNLSKTYGLQFKQKVDMDIGLKYQALIKGQVDAINIFTTDGQLANEQVVVLQDDKNFYPSYRCGTIVKQETLQKFPFLHKTLQKMENIINEEEMAYLNYLVETENINAKKVAKDFLTSKGLLL